MDGHRYAKSPMTQIRKAQVVGQVFIFIIAGLLFVLILGYGYKAINNFLDLQSRVQLIVFRDAIQNEVKSIRTAYGSERKLDLNLPPQYKIFCAVDPLLAGTANDPKTNKGQFARAHPLMYDAWEGNNASTIFTWPMLDIPLQIKDISVTAQGQPGFFCTTISGGKFSLRLKGLGDKAQITEWQEEE